MFCPQGIDTSEVTMAGREILASVGIGQQYTTTIIDKVHRTGNNLGLKPAALADTLESLEEDILDDTGIAVRLPLDEPRCRHAGGDALGRLLRRTACGWPDRLCQGAAPGRHLLDLQ